MISLLWILACKSPPSTGPEADTDTDTDTDTDQDTDTDTDTIGTADTSDSVDCSILPPVPAPFQTFQGWGSAEDFDIDPLGRHVSVLGSGNLTARTPTGDTTLIAPNVSDAAACTRMLPSGDFIVCDVPGNALVKVDTASGAKTTLATGFSYPNGAEVDPDGFIYVAEQNAGRVRRVDSNTGDFTVVATGLDNPNGVIFSPDWQTLYVGSFGGGVVYAIPRTGPDTFDPPLILVEQPGFGGGFDGINVDECGNVYITEFTVGKVWRITPDGTTVNLVADLPSGWIPNMRWGNGINGWDEDVLYVSDRGQGRLFALDIGLRGKPAFMPTPPTP